MTAHPNNIKTIMNIIKYLDFGSSETPCNMGVGASLFSSTYAISLLIFIILPML
jgi:hypothetical protein